VREDLARRRIVEPPAIHLDGARTGRTSLEAEGVAGSDDSWQESDQVERVVILCKAVDSLPVQALVQPTRRCVAAARDFHALCLHGKLELER
jgi:hypothetical protein